MFGIQFKRKVQGRRIHEEAIEYPFHDRGGVVLLFSSMTAMAGNGDFSGDDVTSWSNTNTVGATVTPGNFASTPSVNSESGEYSGYYAIDCGLSIPGSYEGPDITMHEFVIHMGSQTNYIDVSGEQFFSFKMGWEENSGGGHGAKNLHFLDRMVQNPNFLAEDRNGWTGDFGSSTRQLSLRVYNADTSTVIASVNLLNEGKQGVFGYQYVNQHPWFKSEYISSYGRFNVCALVDKSDGGYVSHPQTWIFSETEKFRSVWIHHDGGDWTDNGEWYGEQHFDRCAGEVCIELPAGVNHIYYELSVRSSVYSGGTQNADSYTSVLLPKYYRKGSSKHTVTLDKDSGIESVSGAGEYDANTNAEISAVAKTGYKFVKWDTSTVGFSDSTLNPYTFSVTNDVTYKALSEAKTYTLNFDYNKPSNASGNITGNSITSKTVTYDSKIGTLPNPGLTGWTFKGWTLKNVGIDKDTIWKYDENNLTSVAIWTPNNYNIIYKGGSINQ